MPPIGHQEIPIKPNDSWQLMIHHDMMVYREDYHFMQFKKGDRVRHPKKSDWGIGQVLADTSNGSVRIFFTHAGEKTLSLDFIQLEKLLIDEASSLTLDRLDQVSQPIRSAKGKILCTNCGSPTQFGETANPKRYALGWCEPCFRHSKRTLKDEVTGEKRYLDEFRTIDGIKTHWSPK